MVLILFSIPSSIVFAQQYETVDTLAVYKKVLDSLFQTQKIVEKTGGRVVYADIYGNYDKMRQRDDSTMEAQGHLFVMWFEQEHYEKSVANMLRENKIAFDSIKLEDLVWKGPTDLQSLLPNRQFVKIDKAPLGYSFFDNFFKEKRVIQLSELLLVEKLNVVVVKAKSENRSDKDEWFEMIVLHKEQSEWKILDRTKSCRSLR